MNIFATDDCPQKCAQALDSKRVIKMVLESAQLLSNAAHAHCPELAPYRKTHFNHPCSIWARQHRGNYLWLLQHFIHLCLEYKHRFNKVHACKKLYGIFDNIQYFLEDSKIHDDFVNCSLFKEQPNVILAYRQTLIHKWSNDKRKPNWHNRNKPEWHDWSL